ncbi:alpha-L-fucosidase [Paenibacillus sp. SGZ-1009]|uniref:alpha-L-fucosidase n=1 Tax=Paenibacillus campi TaxID=3106031 RepID=UPI002AFE136B|nr:alpha-L-fucosidase [Paenibacillus sp. SGZ-1009]
MSARDTLRKEWRSEVRQTIGQGPFQANWDSLRSYSAPIWYEQARFGIFVHWGVYAVPAFQTEWYARNMYIQGSAEYEHHRRTYGSQDQFGYKDFIPRFTADRFDADEWADLFKRAGAGFVVPVAEHHDGFAMYDTPFSDWNAAQMGPKRDVIGELADAVRKRYMTFGVSTHRAENWWYYNGGREFPSDVQDYRYTDLYGAAQPCFDERNNPVAMLPPNDEFLEDWLLRTCHLIDRYGPQLLYFDWWIEQPEFKPYLQRLAAYYYNKAAESNRQVVINYKFDAFEKGTAVYDIERGGLASIQPHVWQTCTSIGKTAWCHISNPDYKTAAFLIGDLIDIVSKNGVMLLNVGPRADGTIAQEEQHILLDIGKWLHVNGEAIYGTKPWKIHGEGPTEVVDGTFNDTRRTAYTGADIRFTTRNGYLYVLLLGWPQDGNAVITSLSITGWYEGQIASVHILGVDEQPVWQRTEAGLEVPLPPQLAEQPAIVLKITAL